MIAAMQRQVGTGFLAMIVSSLFFATSGTFAKSLIATGWSPATVVTIRVGGASLALLPWTLRALRGRWAELRGHLPLVAAYGFFGIAAAQLGYFGAVARLDIAVALLIEYLGIVLVVVWIWMRTRRAPHAFTLVGVLLALGGLALVLDVTGAASVNVVGVLWGLFAAVGMGGHYILAARPTPVPAVAFAGLGLVSGAILLLIAGGVGLVPLRAGHGPVTLAGAQLPAWVAFAELCLVAAAAAYLIGIVGARRLGSTMASFVGLSEVLFAVLIAALLLAEIPGPMQIAGGVLIVAGVVAVRVGEMRQAARQPCPSEEDILGEPGAAAVHTP
jgi:drug/metabolite transporter (DMT)-like permease